MGKRISYAFNFVFVVGNFALYRLLQIPKFERIVNLAKSHMWTIYIHIALSDRFCATRSLLLEGGRGRPQNRGYAMYPQRLMVLHRHVLRAIGVAMHDAFALVTTQRKTLEAPRFD